MAYSKVTSEIIEKLKNIVSSEYVLYTSKESLEPYSHDETPELVYYPECVVKPKTAEEISAILKLANRERIPVIPRGLGTGLCGGSLPLYGGITLSLERLNKILELDMENFTITLEPGIALQSIYDVVEANELYYPPTPGEKGAAIGGNINTNAGGMRAVKYGVTRDYIMGLEVVLPTGEIINLGGKTVKCSSGYELIDLIIGSEGTLGVVTKAILKLIPLPKYKLTLYIPFNTIKDAFTACREIIKSKIIPTAMEFIQREPVILAEKKVGQKFPDDTHEAYIMILIDGDSQEAVNSLGEKSAEICMSTNAVDVFVLDTKESQNRIWNLRSNVLEGIKEESVTEELDAVVPRNRILDYIEYTQILSNEKNIPIFSYGHVGDGNMHTHIFKYSLSDEKWHEISKECMEKIYKKSVELGGKISGEHGIGLTRKEHLKYQLDDTQIELMRRLKKAFDPNLILNPGKIFDL